MASDTDRVSMEGGQVKYCISCKRTNGTLLDIGQGEYVCEGSCRLQARLAATREKEREVNSPDAPNRSTAPNTGADVHD